MLTNHEDRAAAIFEFYNQLLGTSAHRDLTINLNELDLSQHEYCMVCHIVLECIQKNAIDVEIVLGQHARKMVILPWITLMCPFDNEIFLFWFKRKQFPVSFSQLCHFNCFV